MSGGLKECLLYYLGRSIRLENNKPQESESSKNSKQKRRCRELKACRVKRLGFWLWQGLGLGKMQISRRLNFTKSGCSNETLFQFPSSRRPCTNKGLKIITAEMNTLIHRPSSSGCRLRDAVSAADAAVPTRYGLEFK